MTIKVLGFLALSLTAASMAANANTETLVYTGAEIGNVTSDGPVSVSGNINGYITLNGPLAANLTDAQVTPTTFSFNGGTPLSSAYALAFPVSEFFAFSTDSHGAITDWEFALSGATNSGTLTEGSANWGGVGADLISFDYTDSAGNSLNSTGFATTPGEWTVRAVAAPEIDPSSAVGGLMLLLGSVAVIRGRTKGVKA